MTGTPVGGVGGLGRLIFNGATGGGVLAVVGLMETAGFGGWGFTGIDTVGLFAGGASPSFMCLVNSSYYLLSITLIANSGKNSFCRDGAVAVANPRR